MQFYFFTEFGRDQIEHNQINNQFLHKRRLKRGQQSFVFDCAYFGKDPSSYMKINGPLDTSFRHILHTKLFSPSKKSVQDLHVYINLPRCFTELSISLILPRSYHSTCSSSCTPFKILQHSSVNSFFLI